MREKKHDSKQQKLVRWRRGFAEKRLFLASCQDRRFLDLLRLTYATRVSVRDAGSTILRVNKRRICLGTQPPRLFQDTLLEWDHETNP